MAQNIPVPSRDLTHFHDNWDHGYAIIDNSFKLLVFNRQMEHILSSFKSSKIEKGQVILDRMPEGFKNNFTDALKQAFGGEPVSDKEQIFQNNDQWFKISYTPYLKKGDTVKTVLLCISDISTKWNEKKSFKENSDFMESLFERAPGIVLVNEKGGIVKVNSAFCRILGYVEEDLVKMNFFELVPLPDRKKYKKQHEVFFSEHSSLSNEIRLYHRNGKVLLILAQTTYLVNEVKEPLAIISVADITESRLAEQELIARGKFYKAIIERSADMKILTTSDGHIMFSSASVNKFLGYTIDEVSGRNVVDFVPIEDIPHLTLIIEHVVNTPGTSVLVQQKILHKNGDWRHCEGTVTNLLNDPNVGAIISNFRDITDRKLAIESLKQSEAHLRAIFNTVDIGIVLLDKTMKIVLFNSVAAEWAETTFNRRFEKERNFLDYISKEQALQFMGNFNKVMSKSVHSALINYKLPDGNCRWYEIRMSPVLIENEEVSGVCITAADITVKKNAEIQREKVTQDLIKRNNDLQQFAYIVSHNLRGPTVNIMALSDMLKNSKALNHTDYKKVIDGLNTSSIKLDSVIRDLNQILQIDHSVTEKREWVNLSELLEELRLTIDHLVNKESAKIIADFSEVPTIKTFRIYLYSAFYNLITNSLKYRNPLISPDITIKSKKINGGIELCFSDNGIGIDLAMHGSKIFGLYNRFHLHKEGKGMGLFMVKKQVEAMGGEISVSSTPGLGTTFRIVLEG